MKKVSITRRDVMLAKEMLSPRKCKTQGKTTRSKADVVDITLQKIEVPRSIMKFYKYVELAAGVMHVNDVPFLTTISSNTHYGTIVALNALK